MQSRSENLKLLVIDEEEYIRQGFADYLEDEIMRY